ncbi:MAG: hypothetical protein PHR64_03530 [Candidatus Shapirobacteria bacterium]|nr:hypothetical protein [Candidatus Shapirobacteria bacterium]MDD5074192.1 hypothetical protein [Candidatus Shapirobacteria bacterium]MDD5481981.1 hypothetical protein [Candidatus Shapirobacteria bacterium]
MNTIRTGPETRELLQVQYMERWEREAKNLLSLLAVALEPVSEWIEIEMRLNQGIALANFLGIHYAYETRLYNNGGNQKFEGFEWYLGDEGERLSRMDNDFDRIVYLFQRAHAMLFDHADPDDYCKLLISVPL